MLNLRNHMWLPDGVLASVLLLILVPGIIGMLCWFSMLTFLGASWVIPVSWLGWLGSWVTGLFAYSFLTGPESHHEVL